MNRKIAFQDLPYLIIAILLLISSCATKVDTEFIEIDSKKIEESLGVNHSKFNRFQVENSKSNLEIKNKKEISQNKNSKDKILLKKIDKKTKGHISGEAVPKKEKQNLDRIDGGALKPNEPYPSEFALYDNVSKKVWPKSNPIVDIGEKFVFKVSYLGITAGHIQMETQELANIGGQSVYHFSAKLRSARYYSYIYTLDDSLDTYVTRDSFIPIKYVLSQRESSQTVDDLQLFDQQELKTYHWYKRIKHSKLKKVELTKHIPLYFQDSFSALHFVRSLPLMEGERYEYPIVTRGKIWILKVKVEAREEIEIMGKEVEAIKISAETHFPGVLEKRGDILFWFSADEKKKLLKFEAQVKIGAAAGELVEYKAGKPL